MVNIKIIIGNREIALFDDDEPFVQIVAACALTTTNPVAEVTAKTDVPTLKKWLVLDDGSYAKVEGLSIGDSASFAIEVTLPTTFEGHLRQESLL